MALILRLVPLAIFLLATGQATASIYDKLHSFVMSHSDGPNVLPIFDTSHPLLVDMHIGLLDIFHVDRKNHEIEVSFMLSMSWNSSIVWNPSEFDNIHVMAMGSDEIWHPDVFVFNAASRYQKDPHLQINVAANGKTSTTIFYRLKILCDMSNGDHCHISVASNAYSNNVIALRDPKDLELDLEPHFDNFRHHQSGFPMKESHLVKDEIPIPGRGEMDRMNLEFSFRDPHRHHRHRFNDFFQMH